MPDIELKTRGIVRVLAVVFVASAVMVSIHEYDTQKTYALFNRQEQEIRRSFYCQELARIVCQVDFEKPDDAQRIQSLMHAFHGNRSSVSDLKVIYKTEEGYRVVPHHTPYNETLRFMKVFVLDSFEQKSIVEIERSKGDCVQSTKQQMRLENTMGMVFRLNPECKAYLSVHFIK